MLTIKIDIKDCSECRHVDHSGAFTVRGARQICGHSSACGQVRVKKKAFVKEYPEYKDKSSSDYSYSFHWIHRVIVKPYIIPDWCPLFNGAKY